MVTQPDPLQALQDKIATLFPGLMGVRITLAAADRIEATMQVQPHLCTSGEILHGGAYMAFADTLGALGTVINLQAHQFTTTTDSSTNPTNCALSRRKHS
jgi:1,4-dihydroxy-2-naphthoyl-CoA hydrolase